MKSRNKNGITQREAKMDRRSWIKTAALSLGAGLATKIGMRAARAADAVDPKTLPEGGKGMIVLYCDLAVIPAREKEMLDVFHNTFRPAAQKFKGFVDLKILKYNQTMQGEALSKPINYRFQLTYESLALQQIWVHSPTHVKLWPLMAATLSNPNDFQVLIFNNA
jgi:hypothetical protein